MATPPTARFAFMKLHVPDMAPALAFWQEAFGFVVTGTYDLPQFLENILALPGQTESGPNLMLLQPRPDQDLTVGPGHGPLGLAGERENILEELRQIVSAGDDKPERLLPKR